ncbi:p-hydroxybenzoic acid efflux pump subunit AaeA [subsurface metagenome]
MLIILVVCSVSALSSSCAYESEAAVSENQIATVQRGDLVIDITAASNLALSAKEDLGFQSTGYVEEILVEEGDAVTEGQVLARMDTTSLELAVKEEEIDLEIATDSYRKITYPYTYNTLIFDVPASIAGISDALCELNKSLAVMQDLELTQEQYREVWHSLNRAKDDLLEARARVARGSGADVFASGILPMSDFWTLRAAQLKMEKAQVELDEANNDLEKALIVAPFDGFITEVNVSRGGEVKKGTVVLQIADPDKFEAEIKVSETEIFHVKLGGEAWVQVDVLPGVSLPAKITHISPTATIEAGVVNYTVTVEIESLQTVMQEWQEVRQEEAVQVMVIQWLEGQGGQQEMPTMPEAFQLRDGLTVSVSLLTEGKNDVLLVPNEAITYQEGKTYIQVLTDGVIEPCLITTGISNYQYTEVTNGLNAGKQVIVH